jgi:4-alpha-glucanotransferase
MIALALRSPANTAVYPLQDVLGLGSEARMNVPGREEGNWSWRFQWQQLTPEIEQRLHRLTQEANRN